MPGPKPLVVAVRMGYGHLRPATTLADALGVTVSAVDQPPLASPAEARVWAATRALYESVSRASQGGAGGPFRRRLLEGVTEIAPLYPHRDLSHPDAAVGLLAWLGRRGLGAGLIARLRESGAPLLATFYAPAVLAAAAGVRDVHCLITDADLHRIWVPADPARARVRYFAPGLRVLRRLRAYGVPASAVEVTGFPLPHSLVGGDDLPALRRNLAARLVRLDPSGLFRDGARRELTAELGALPADEERRPPHLVYAVGGAGAQSEVARDLLRGARGLLRAGRLRLTLVAGIRRPVAARFAAWIAEADLGGAGVDVLVEDDVFAYFRRFDELLAGADLLWTKPSELVFYAALGLPLLLSPPVGAQEIENRSYALTAGAALDAGPAAHAAEWLEEQLADGTLAAAAWAGFRRLPAAGLYRILDRLGQPHPPGPILPRPGATGE